MTDKIQQIRDYADSHDLSEEIEQGHWEADVADDPMITTSLRLPKSLLDWVRAQAAEQHVKPTAWIRELLERQRAGQPDLEHRVTALEAAMTAVLAQPQPVRKKTARTASKVAAAAKTTRTRATRDPGGKSRSGKPPPYGGRTQPEHEEEVARSRGGRIAAAPSSLLRTPR